MHRCATTLLAARGALLAALLGWCGGCGGSEELSLSVCAGAGLMRPVEDLRAAFERERGVRVVASYAGAGELMARIGLEQQCDVFIPGARKYVEEADARGWIRPGTIRDLVLHVPAIAVPRKNPARIRRLADLARPGVRVAVGDPSACAIGRVASSIFARNGIARAVRANTAVMTPTVNQLLIYAALGEVDAAIVWQDAAAWAEHQDQLALIEIPPDENVIKTISTAVAAHSERAELARELNEFIGSPMSQPAWEKWGFEPCTD